MTTRNSSTFLLPGSFLFSPLNINEPLWLEFCSEQSQGGNNVSFTFGGPNVTFAWKGAKQLSLRREIESFRLITNRDEVPSSRKPPSANFYIPLPAPFPEKPTPPQFRVYSCWYMRGRARTDPGAPTARALIAAASVV